MSTVVVYLLPFILLIAITTAFQQWSTAIVIVTVAALAAVAVFAIISVVNVVLSIIASIGGAIVTVLTHFFFL